MPKTINNSSMPLLTRGVFLKVFIASFFLQAVWNFRSLISIGFSVCLFPVLNKLYSREEDKRQFMHRHLKFFNAHPYFASYALGASIRLEEMAAKGDPEIPHILDHLKDLLISPLGAVGDRLFWATIKPASLVFGMGCLLIAPTVLTKSIALIITFSIYNIPHLYFRYQGIIKGYKYGMDIYKYIGQERFERLRKIYMFIFLLSAIVIVALYSPKLFAIKQSLILVFLFSLIYAMIFNKLLKNFYLVSFATFTFFIIVGILFF